MHNVAILGFGVVGSGVYEIIKNNAEVISKKIGADVKVKHILDIRDFENHPDKHLFTKDFEVILNDPEVDIVAEVIGGTKPAFDFTKRALESGKHVVTSNKELVAKHGSELLKTAHEHNVSYLFEASVGGGIPVIEPVRNCLAANNITEIKGILNGTTNYILTQMVKFGRSFDEALKSAQEKGYAEANPSADVDGIDAQRKIAILTSLALGKSVDSEKIPADGITKLTLTDVSFAKKMGYKIKLIGYSKIIGDNACVFVSPMLVSVCNPLALVDDVYNAITVTGDMVGDTMYFGQGAGKLATASAVLGDITEIMRGGIKRPLMWTDGKDNILNPESQKIRLFVRAEASAKSAFEAAFGKINEITKDGELAFITDEEEEGKLREMLSQINGINQIIRVLA